MDRTAEKERKAMIRIAALLLALADLAVRAAGLRGPTRSIVLWALGRADAVAREFVSGRGSGAAFRSMPSGPMVRSGNEPADAIRLALSLRTLALMVRILALQIRRHWSRQHGASPRSLSEGRRGEEHRRLHELRILARRTTARLDTS